MKSHELFAAIPEALGLEILDDAQAIDKQFYRAVLDAVAQTRKVRTIFLLRQAKPQRHAAALSTLTRHVSEAIADNLLRTWFLKKQNKLLTDFLDALKIEHEDGVVDNLPAAVEEPLLCSAVDDLYVKHRPEIVTLYLHAFNEMNQPNWAGLDTLLKTDPRAVLGSAPPPQ